MVDLQERNKQHFGQAHRTPFTTQPLNMIDWGANNNIAETLLQGDIHENLTSDNQYAHAVLQFIAEHRQLPEIDLYITPEEIAKGFWSWKETTSTSPSHQGAILRQTVLFSTVATSFNVFLYF
jgi:hypothetical protein